MEKETCSLSIVVPLYNEEESVEQLYRKVAAAGDRLGIDYEIVFVDDGSSDRTWEIIERLKHTAPRLRGVRFRRNYGQTSAMVAGFDEARGDIIVTMDGDLQNDPDDIPLLLKKIGEGYDIVSGWRRDRKDHFSRVLPSRIANKIISLTTGVRLHDYGCSLKAYRAECIRSIKAYGEMHRFFPALASMTGARVTEVPVNHYPRRHGVSKYGFDRIFKVFSDIFSINLIIRFSSMPLKGFALFSLPFLMMGLFFGAIAGLAVLQDWRTLKITIFVIASGLSFSAVLHLVFLGILGELLVASSSLEHTQLPSISTKKYTRVEGGTELVEVRNGRASALGDSSETD